MSKKQHELTGQDHAHPDGPGKDKKNPRTYLNDAERMLEKYQKAKEAKGEDPTIIEWKAAAYMNRKLDEEYKLRGFRDKDWLEVLNADKRGEKAKY